MADLMNDYEASGISRISPCRPPTESGNLVEKIFFYHSSAAGESYVV